MQLISHCCTSARVPSPSPQQSAFTYIVLIGNNVILQKHFYQKNCYNPTPLIYFKSLNSQVRFHIHRFDQLKIKNTRGRGGKYRSHCY